jgi:hypothetical protein
MSEIEEKVKLVTFICERCSTIYEKTDPETFYTCPECWFNFRIIGTVVILDGEPPCDQ